MQRALAQRSRVKSWPRGSASETSMPPGWFEFVIWVDLVVVRVKRWLGMIHIQACDRTHEVIDGGGRGVRGERRPLLLVIPLFQCSCVCAERLMELMSYMCVWVSAIWACCGCGQSARPPPQQSTHTHITHTCPLPPTIP